MPMMYTDIQGEKIPSKDVVPEKLTFDGVGCRTLKMNEAAEIIYVINKELRAKKWGKNHQK
jgi:hypothetical protein